MKNRNITKKEHRIKNLEELRIAKRKLQLQIRGYEKRQDNSLINKAFNFLTFFYTDLTFASSKIENSLNYLSRKAATRYNMNSFSRTILSGVVMLAVPIITTKLQDFIRKKL